MGKKDGVDSQINVGLNIDTRAYEKQEKELRERIKKFFLDNEEARRVASERMSKEQKEEWGKNLELLAKSAKNKNPLQGMTVEFFRQMAEVGILTERNLSHYLRTKEAINDIIDAESKVLAEKRKIGREIQNQGNTEAKFIEERKKEAKFKRGYDYSIALEKAKYHEKQAEFYQEEIDALQENITLVEELDRSIQKLNKGKKGKEGKIDFSLLGERIKTLHWKTDEKEIDLLIENLGKYKDLISEKVEVGKQGNNAIANAARQRELATEISHESEIKRAQEKRQNLEEAGKVIEKAIVAEEERYQRLEALQIKGEEEEAKEQELLEEEIENRTEGSNKIGNIETQKADEILEAKQSATLELIGVDDILIQNNKKIAESEKESLKTRAQQWQEYAEKVSAISQQVSEITGMVTNSLGGMFSQLSASYAQDIESLNEKIAAVDEEKEAALEKVALTEDERRAREEELAQQKINLEYATSEEQKNKADERIATLQGELGAEDSINRDFESKKASLEKEKDIIESTLDALTGISGMEQHGENYDDIAFANRMEYEEKQRQLKKRRGIRR